MSRKDSYIYISKEIHKDTKITSNPLKKLAGHCVEHNVNKRNHEGRDSRPLPFLFLSPSCVLLPLVSSTPSFPLVYRK